LSEADFQFTRSPLIDYDIDALVAVACSSDSKAGERSSEESEPKDNGKFYLEHYV